MKYTNYDDQLQKIIIMVCRMYVCPGNPVAGEINY